MNSFFEIGEVVWGKIKGYPWWPAVITDSSQSLIYTIKFYSDNTYAKLSSKYLLKYEENKDKIIETNKKNKKLLEAIKAADSDINNPNNIYYMPLENNILNNYDNSQINDNTKKIQLNKLSYSSENIEPKNLEKINNNDLNNNLINKTETMSIQNNKVNIFSITKNNKNNNTNNNPTSPKSSSRAGEESQITSEKKNVETNKNNNDIIINKSLLSLNNDDKISLLLLNHNKENNENENGNEQKIKNQKILKSQIKEEEEEEIMEEEKKEVKEEVKEKEKEIKKETYYIKIEIENLEVKNNKKKDNKTKDKIVDKAKEEKKRREEEDHFIYQIDEYFYKIFLLFSTKKFDKLDYEKENFKKILKFLSNYKRANFIEFLKMTNISKYIQYFVCYMKEYDTELEDLSKKVYRNFHKQFNKEFFNNHNKEI